MRLTGPDSAHVGRDLVEFERDDHKQCVMHKTRAGRLEPLVKVLSPEAFPSLYWSLRMEVASAYREIMLIKEDHKRPYGKVLLHSLYEMLQLWEWCYIHRAQAVQGPSLSM